MEGLGAVWEENETLSGWTAEVPWCVDVGVWVDAPVDILAGFVDAPVDKLAGFVDVTGTPVDGGTPEEPASKEGAAKERK